MDRGSISKSGRRAAAVMLIAVLTLAIASAQGKQRRRQRRTQRLEPVLDRPLGRSALFARPGTDRRPESDRGYERAAAGVLGPRWRPEAGLGEQLRRGAVRSFARLLQRAGSAGDVHARRQRLDRLRPAGQRRLLHRSIDSTTSASSSSETRIHSASGSCRRRYKPPRCASTSSGAWCRASKTAGGPFAASPTRR